MTEFLCGATDWATCGDGRPHVYGVCHRPRWHAERDHREFRPGDSVTVIWPHGNPDPPHGPWCEHTEAHRKDREVHVYVSTGCLHGRHVGYQGEGGKCREVCKYCSAKCRCECHQKSLETS